MTHVNQAERRPAHGRPREARARRSFDAVLATYIRELSTGGSRRVPSAYGTGATAR